MPGLLIYGIGELATLVHGYCTAAGRPVAAFTADADRLTGDRHLGLPAVAFDELAERFPPAEHDLLIAVGYADGNRARLRIADHARSLGYALASHVDPAAIVHPSAAIGGGCVVMPGAIVEPGVTLGDGVIAWCGAHVAHHTEIGAGSFLAPRACVAGRVVIGERCFLGANCTVRDHVRIGAGSVIGAGAIVKSDVAPDSVYSAPATPLDPRRPGDLRL